MYKVIELEIDPTLSGDTGVFEVAWVEYPAIEQELIYFGKQKFYKATEEVSAVACRAIKENEKRGNPAATQVGKVRAQQLCNQDEISLETIKRMKSYLERAATYYTGNYDDNGTISYDLWGGKKALEWVDRILKKEQDMGTQDFVKPGASETKDEFIGRCIPYVINEGKTPEQAAGQCYGMWENREFAPTKVSFDWDDTLSTRRGKNLLEQELSRGSIIYIISARNLTTKEMIDLSKEYRFPASNIYTTGSNKAKVEKIKELGIKRHYDNNFNVVQELGPVGIKFDYDVSGLPAYDNYPASGDTDSMLIEPQLPPVLFDGCGCGGNFEGLEDACWEGYIAIGTKIVDGREVPNCVPEEMAQQMSMFPGQVGVIDGNPIFETITDAENHSIYIGCVGHHTHTTVEGNQVYMACETHPDNFSEYTEEEVETLKLLKFLAETDYEKFEAVMGSLRGATESEIFQRNHTKPVFYFKYDRVMEGSPDRDFCMSIENRYFRRFEIDLLEDKNKEFGHNRQGYSKWDYKGGPQCVHAWRRFVYTPKERNREEQLRDLGMVSGKPGIAPQAMVGKGYYPGTPRYNANLSKQNVSYMKDIECAFGDMCKLNLENKQQVFSAQEEQRMIYTPLMIPNILIPRIDEVSNEKYYVKFTPDTIKNIRDKFMGELRNRKTNYEHTDKKFEDIIMVETWIVQGEKDKAYELGFTQEQVPLGTWMGAYKVLDTPEGNYVWNEYIKPGKVKGASVEGNFILNFSVQQQDEYLLRQVINIINKITN